MYKRIVVAVDGTAASNPALREAIRLAGASQSALLIMHVVCDVNINVETSEAERRYEDSMLNVGERTLKKAAAIAQKAGVAAETRLLELLQIQFRVAAEIVREAAKWHADLIVAGTHGREGLSRLVLGSVAEGLAKAARVPVLLVRAGA
ncbi:MAG: universal stress protein [Burkholderiales bacterium]